MCRAVLAFITLLLAPVAGDDACAASENGIDNGMCDMEGSHLLQHITRVRAAVEVQSTQPTPLASKVKAATTTTTTAACQPEWDVAQGKLCDTYHGGFYTFVGGFANTSSVSECQSLCQSKGMLGGTWDSETNWCYARNITGFTGCGSYASQTSFRNVNNDCTFSPVGCGAHSADSCAECPQGHAVGWCNGQCTWSDGQCAGKACVDTANGATDVDGDDCSEYHGPTADWDDDDFTANLMCCGAGGGAEVFDCGGGCTSTVGCAECQK